MPLGDRFTRARVQEFLSANGLKLDPCDEYLAEVDDDGFLRSRDNIYSIVESGRKGIFFAGACTGTKTVPETVAEARAAALSAYRYIKGNA